MERYGQYAETNTVHSLVIYEWASQIDMKDARHTFDRISGIVGHPPDLATVVDENEGKDYPYASFMKRNIIQKKEWLSFGYLWKRSDQILSDFSIDIGCAIRNFRCVEVHIDETSVEDISSLFEKVLSIIADGINPIYGIGYKMPYYWGPREFAHGTASSRYSVSDKSLFGAPDRLKQQSFQFSRTFHSRNEERHLDIDLRDVFEINLISEGHLNRRVGRKSLRDWIKANELGVLEQMTPVTWRWNVPVAEICKARKDLIDAGITVVKE
ncbi:MAG: hypothetical protein EOS28_29140 [Mesorhizobium sp.]|nr:MAG: hypothetical protein EOS28_29140 [Mesorhizobium sp.]